MDLSSSRRRRFDKCLALSVKSLSQLETTAFERRFTLSTAKEEVESLLNRLPEDCSLEDIQYHLYVIEKVRQGLEAADTQGSVSQEEVEQRLGKWLTE